MKGRVRLTNFAFGGGGLEADLEVLADASSSPAPQPEPVPQPLPEPLPLPAPPPAPVPAPVPQPRALPLGFNSDPDVGFRMLVEAMDAHGLTPVGVQNNGKQIVRALNDYWPGLNVWLSTTDAPVWPGFGSIDVTIDSGKGGWAFRPDGATPYAR